MKKTTKTARKQVVFSQAELGRIFGKSRMTINYHVRAHGLPMARTIDTLETWQTHFACVGRL